MLSLCLVGVGLIYSFGHVFFVQPLYLTHSQIMPHWLLGGGALLIASFRLSALYINGVWRRSPHLRALGAFLACFAWFELTLVVWQGPIYGATVVIWPIFLAFDIHSAFAAAASAARSDVRHKQCEGGVCDADRGT